MKATTIVGMKFCEHKLDENKVLILKRDYDNKYDKNAVGVYQDGNLVAYVVRDDTYKFHDREYEAFITKKYPNSYLISTIINPNH